MVDVRDSRAVRRPGRCASRSERLRYLASVAATTRDRPDIASAVEFAVRVPGGSEGEGVAIGRPGGLGVIPVAISHLSTCLRCDVQDEEVPPLVVDEALPIQPVLHGCDGAIGLCLLGIRVGERPGLRAEGDPCSVRRPCGDTCAEWQFSQDLRLAAGRGDNRQLRLVFAAFGDEGEHRTVGRPSGGTISLRSGRELTRLVATGFHHPNRRFVAIGLAVQRRHDERDSLTVGGNVRLADPFDRVKVVRSHCAHRSLRNKKWRHCGGSRDGVTGWVVRYHR